EGRSTLTKASAILGSPEYMSPEQINTPRDVDERADIWSLGVTLYEMLSGEMPYAAPTAGQILIQVLIEPPRPLHRVAPMGRRELADAVGRCMERDGEARYGNVAQFAAAIERYAGPAPRSPAQRIASILGESPPSGTPRSSATLSSAGESDEGAISVS